MLIHALRRSQWTGCYGKKKETVLSCIRTTIILFWTKKWRVMVKLGYLSGGCRDQLIMRNNRCPQVSRHHYDNHPHSLVICSLAVRTLQNKTVHLIVPSFPRRASHGETAWSNRGWKWLLRIDVVVNYLYHVHFCVPLQEDLQLNTKTYRIFHIFLTFIVKNNVFIFIAWQNAV